MGLDEKMSLMAVPAKKELMWSSKPLYMPHLAKFGRPHFFLRWKKTSQKWAHSLKL